MQGDSSCPGTGEKQKERGGYYARGRPYYAKIRPLLDDGIGTGPITVRLCGDLRHICYGYYAIFLKLLYSYIEVSIPISNFQYLP